MSCPLPATGIARNSRRRPHGPCGPPFWDQASWPDDSVLTSPADFSEYREHRGLRGPLPSFPCASRALPFTSSHLPFDFLLRARHGSSAFSSWYTSPLSERLGRGHGHDYDMGISDSPSTLSSESEGDLDCEESETKSPRPKHCPKRGHGRGHKGQGRDHGRAPHGLRGLPPYCSASPHPPGGGHPGGHYKGNYGSKQLSGDRPPTKHTERHGRHGEHASPRPHVPYGRPRMPSYDDPAGARVSYGCWTVPHLYRYESHYCVHKRRR